MTPCPRSPLVLVVDDDAATAHLIRGILSGRGFHAVCAYDLAGAVTVIREKHPELILLDVSLPDGNGLDLCRKLKAEPATAQTPILFISANEALPDKIKGFEAGAVDYISKPFAGEEVIARVSTHLRLRQAYEALAELQAQRIQGLASAQETLMPSPAEFPEAKFHVSRKQVLNAGGDFYDVIPVGDQLFDYVVADASGHDLAASFWTAALKTLLGQYATPASSPQAILGHINSALVRILPAGVFFTLIYARLNRRTGNLQLINAGHPPAILVQHDESDARVMHQEGDLLGAFGDPTFGLRELELKRGDRFFLFSDGLIETGGNRDRGLSCAQAACSARRQGSLA